MKKLFFLPLLLLLAQCQIGMVSLDSSQHLEAALRGGEADHASYELIDYEVLGDEVLTISQKGRESHFIKVRMHVSCQLDPALSYHAGKAHSTKRISPVSNTNEKSRLAPKEFYIPLRLNGKDSDKARQFLSNHGIEAQMRVFRKMRPPAHIRALDKTYELADFPPRELSLTRTPIKGLNQGIKAGIYVSQSQYYTEPHWGSAFAVYASQAFIDAPINVAGLVLGSIYENLIGQFLR